MFAENNVATTPLAPANCGWNVAWPAAVVPTHEGTPLKNLLLHANGQDAVGELIVTRHGLEGGPLYALGPALRNMKEPALTIDFKPTFTIGKLVAKMESARRNFLHEAQLRWKLPLAACDLIEATHGPIDSAEQLAKLAKSYHLPLTGPRPLAEAISSAGGVCWEEIDDGLMLRKLPGIFVAGEMIDWEAPTGGYLIQGCFSTGTVAAQSALNWLETR
jgi:predicted flavoprotein YhiN